MENLNVELTPEVLEGLAAAKVKEEGAGGNGGNTGEGGSGGDGSGNSRESGTDPLDTKELESKVSSLLQKTEDDLTEEELKFLEDNSEIVEKIGSSKNNGGDGNNDENEDEGILSIIAKEEGFIEEPKFEDDIDGIKQYLAERDKQRDKKILENFFSANPEIAKIYNHVVVEKKPLQTLVMKETEPDIIKQEIKPISDTLEESEKQAIVDQHTKIIKESLKGKVPDSAIEIMIKSSIEEGTTEKLARDAQLKLKEEYESKIKSIEEEQKKQIELQQQQEKEAQEIVSNMISKGVIASNVIIPQSERERFKKFLLSPIDNSGLTKHVATLENLTPEENMLIDWMLYLKNKHGKIDLSLIKYKTTIKKFLKKTKDKNSGRSNRGGGNNSSGSSFADIFQMPDRF